MRDVMRQNFCRATTSTFAMNKVATVFFVDGKAFSFGDKLSFQDLAGHESRLH